MGLLTEFSTALRTDSDRPEKLALLVGKLTDPGLDVNNYVRRLDELADQVEQSMPVGALGRARAEALIAVMHDKFDFFGNVENYYEASNSFLHRVLDTHLGLPITLCLLYTAVGRRIGMNMRGLGLPGHFMLEYSDMNGVWILDTFHGKVVASEELSYYLTQIFQQPIRISVSLEQYRTDTNAWMLRILNNLRSVYISQHRLNDALSVLNYMVVVEPEEASLWRDRGMLHYSLENMLSAENDLRRYFLLRNRLHLFTGETELVFSGVAFEGLMPEAEQKPTQEDQRVLFVLRQIRDEIRRLN